MKKVLFYEKFKSPGHREYILDLLKNNLDLAKHNPLFFRGISQQNNFLSDLIRLYHKEKFDHCHLLTLDDCLFDFKNKHLLDKFLGLNVSLTATIFSFDILQFPQIIIEWKGHLAGETTIYSLLARRIIDIIGLPDERVKNLALYPLFNSRLKYLPDFPRFQPSPHGNCRVNMDFGLKEGVPTFLMFGKMDSYKGLELLADVINRNLLPPDLEINIIIAGENVQKIEIESNNSNVNLIQINKFIDIDLANKLFSISDCIIMPFIKGFRKSSGVFSIACSYGKFMIVPSEGILGWRVKKYKNGVSFKPGSAYSLAKKILYFTKIKNSLKYPIKGSLEYAKLCALENYIQKLKNVVGYS